MLSSLRPVTRVVVLSLLGSLLAVPSIATATSAGRATSATSATRQAHDARAHAYAPTSTGFGGEARGLSVSTPIRLRGESGDVLAYAPAAANARASRTVVYLHGRNGRAENGCPWLRAGAADVGWLVCPRGAEPDEGGRTASWGGDVGKQGDVVDGALRAVRARGASSEPGVAVGFSQGSYVALDLVKTHRGHFRGLVSIAAPAAHPSAAKLRDAGVVRVVLAAGSLDDGYAPLVRDAERLATEGASIGLETRFVDLGHVGHTYAAENPDALSEAIAWAGAASA